MSGLIKEHGTKLYGALTTLFGTVGGLITTGAFNELLSKMAIGWLGIICTVSTAVLGAMTLSRGWTNTAAIKVAETVNTALLSTPPQTEPPPQSEVKS